MGAFETGRAMVEEAAADCGLTVDEVAGDMADSVILALADEGYGLDDIADGTAAACGTPRYEVLKRAERLGVR